MPKNMEKINFLPVPVSKNPMIGVFSKHANGLIREINGLIDEYNNTTENSLKLLKLYQINELRRKIEDEHPQDVLIPEFIVEIEDKLFKGCQEQFANFKISMHEQSLAQNHPLNPRIFSAPINPLANMFANMSSDDGRRILEVLAEGNHYDQSKLSTLFQNFHHKYDEIIDRYENKYLGGENSKNYIFTSRNTLNPASFVLRVDDRLGGAREMDTYLRNKLSCGYSDSHRSSTFTNF